MQALPNPQDLKKFSLIKRGDRDEDIHISPLTNLLQLRQKYLIEEEWRFVIPGMSVTQEMEPMLQLQFIQGDEIVLENPSREHEVSVFATPLNGDQYALGSITQMQYSYQLSSAEMNDAKYICVIGQTGSGKSSLLNTILNYCLGVQITDKVRYRLVVEDWATTQLNAGAESVTPDVTMYHIEPTPRSPPLIIVDTPGFGDTRGVEQDKIIAKKIKELFSKKLDRIHSIAFVCIMSLERLTSIQEYVLASMTEMFGGDIAQCVSVLATFCDGGPVLVKNALLASKSFNSVTQQLRPETKLVFEFNNSAIFVDPEADPSNQMIKNFWNLGMSGVKVFLEQRIKNVNAISLHQTKENIHIRDQIECQLHDMRASLDYCMAQEASLVDMVSEVKKVKGDKDGNEKFNITRNLHHIVKREKPAGQFNSICIDCNNTCHPNCAFSNDKEKASCCVMTAEYCTVCAKKGKKCHWSRHYNLPYFFEHTTEKILDTDEVMRAKYVDASSKLSAKSQILGGIGKKIMYKKIESQRLVIQINQSLGQLRRIALNVNSYASTIEYLKLQIEMEQKTKKPGYVMRVKQLTDKIDDAAWLATQAKDNQLDTQMSLLQQQEQELKNFDMEKFCEQQLESGGGNTEKKGGLFNFSSWFGK